MICLGLEIVRVSVSGRVSANVSIAVRISVSVSVTARTYHESCDCNDYASVE